jgi:hypothetical protein
MKSIKPKKPFTLDDLEQGLMLAGYLMPANEQELIEKEAVEKLEKEQAEERKIIFFKRVVLAAEVAAKLHDEPTLGRVKFQKLVYLCEYVAAMDLLDRYLKQVAGPFDNKFMHSIAKEFKTNKWFETVEVLSNGIRRTRYVPLGNMKGYRQYYQRYFGAHDDAVQHVIRLFRTMKSGTTELHATVHACILELYAKSLPITQDPLITLFYAWSDAKAKFSEAEVLSSAEWLKENGLIDVDLQL